VRTHVVAEYLETGKPTETEGRKMLNLSLKGKKKKSALMKNFKEIGSGHKDKKHCKTDDWQTRGGEDRSYQGKREGVEKK